MVLAAKKFRPAIRCRVQTHHLWGRLPFHTVSAEVLRKTPPGTLSPLMDVARQVNQSKSCVNMTTPSAIVQSLRAGWYCRQSAADWFKIGFQTRSTDKLILYLPLSWPLSCGPFLGLLSDVAKDHQDVLVVTLRYGCENPEKSTFPYCNRRQDKKTSSCFTAGHLLTPPGDR